MALTGRAPRTASWTVMALAAVIGAPAGCGAGAVPPAPAPQRPADCVPAELLRLESVAAMGLAECFRGGLWYSEGTGTLTRIVQERADSASPWLASEQHLDAGFALTAVGFRDGGELLYVAGTRDPDCSDVIEEWRFDPPPGAQVLRAELSASTTPAIGPIGTPAPALALRSGLAGEAFVPPAGRGASREPRRRVVYAGDALGCVRSLVADPQGRYLLLQAHGDSGVYRLDLESVPTVPKLLFEAATTPSLARTNRMAVYDLPTAGGLAFVLLRAEFDVVPIDAEWVLLRDPDNDGCPDSIEAFTNAEWQASPHSDRSTWRELIHADASPP